jgi:hypothetical protein
MASFCTNSQVSSSSDEFCCSLLAPEVTKPAQGEHKPPLLVRRDPRLSTLFKLVTALEVPLVDLSRGIEPAALQDEVSEPGLARAIPHPEEIRSSQ